MKIKLQLKNIIWEKDNFKIINCKVLNKNLIDGEKIKSEMICYINNLKIFTKGDIIIAVVNIKINEYGYYLNIEKIEEKLTINVAQIKKFLKIKGIGIKLIDKLTDKYKLATIDTIINKNNKNEIIDLIKNENKYNKLYNYVIKNIEYNNLNLFLQRYNLEYKTLQIWDIYKENSIDVIKKSFYRLYNIFNIKELELLKEFNILTKKDTELANITFTIYNELKKGNLYCYYDKKFEIIALKRLLDENILEITNNKIYFKTIKNAAINIKKFIDDKIKKDNKNKNINKNFYNDIKKINDLLDIKQITAINTAINNKLTVITGGAGSGKTYILNVLIKLLEDKKFTYSLTAPTGKAAKRITEQTNRKAQTIHRELGILEEENFNFNNDNNIFKKNFLIIDEAGMLDIFLFNKIINKLDSNVSLILVGDYNQLPAIGAGCIFKNLLDNKDFKNKIILDKIYRQKDKDSLIIKNANMIIKNTNIETLKTGKDFIILDKSIKNVLGSYYTLIKNYNENIKDITTIVPTNTIGEIINRHIQEKFNKNNISITINNNTFKEGDKVIQLKNNYDLNVFNGEIGEIKKIDNENEEVFIKFDDKEILYDKTNINEIQLAYAITCHKFQGSQNKNIIIFLDDSIDILITKNWLYTAITRAEERCILIGDKDYINKVINKEIVIKRSDLFSI